MTKIATWLMLSNNIGTLCFQIAWLILAVCCLGGAVGFAMYGQFLDVRILGGLMGIAGAIYMVLQVPLTKGYLEDGWRPPR